VAPILVAAPAYFSGALTFGGMMMAVGAFNQVQLSLRWYVDNFSSIADWRATLLRVAEFRRALIACDALGPVGPRGPVESPEETRV
jgi:putative ATP-binding cassette transporter